MKKRRKRSAYGLSAGMRSNRGRGYATSVGRNTGNGKNGRPSLKQRSCDGKTGKNRGPLGKQRGVIAMNLTEAWRVGDQRRREAEGILIRSGIPSCGLCAFKIDSQGREPVGTENIVEAIVPNESSSDDRAVIVVLDGQDNPKACSLKSFSAAEADQLVLAAAREAAACTAAERLRRREADQHGTIHT